MDLKKKEKTFKIYDFRFLDFFKVFQIQNLNKSNEIHFLNQMKSLFFHIFMSKSFPPPIAQKKFENPIYFLEKIDYSRIDTYSLLLLI
jgi:hypothetical protein